MEMSRKKLIGATILALILTAGAAAYGWYGARSAAVDFRLAQVERGAITAVVSVTGTLNPVVSVQVGSQVSGQIKEILVDFNSQVKKGQVIARIDPDSFTLKVNQALADLLDDTAHRCLVGNVGCQYEDLGPGGLERLHARDLAARGVGNFVLGQPGRPLVARW